MRFHEGTGDNSREVGPGTTHRIDPALDRAEYIAIGRSIFRDHRRAGPSRVIDEDVDLVLDKARILFSRRSSGGWSVTAGSLWRRLTEPIQMTQHVLGNLVEECADRGAVEVLFDRLTAGVIKRPAKARSMWRMSAISSRITSCWRISRVASSFCSSPCTRPSRSFSASGNAAISRLSSSGDSGIFRQSSG